MYNKIIFLSIIIIVSAASGEIYMVASGPSEEFISLSLNIDKAEDALLGAMLNITQYLNQTGAFRNISSYVVTEFGSSGTSSNLVVKGSLKENATAMDLVYNAMDIFAIAKLEVPDKIGNMYIIFTHPGYASRFVVNNTDYIAKYHTVKSIHNPETYNVIYYIDGNLTNLLVEGTDGKFTPPSLAKYHASLKGGMREIWNEI